MAYVEETGHQQFGLLHTCLQWGVIQKVWMALGEPHHIISAKLLSGRTLVHVYSPENPSGGFEPVEPDLEDVYFSAMTGHYPPSHQTPKLEEANA